MERGRSRIISVIFASSTVKLRLSVSKLYRFLQRIIPLYLISVPIFPLGLEHLKCMTGKDLHQLLLWKWGRSYDVQLRRFQDKIFVQVMWKYLEQASFPLSQGEYMAHLDQVANYLVAWGSTTQVQTYIEQTRDRPRLGKVVSIPLDLGEKASEWIL